ncbi:MAG: YebC/PmpR family DNA-binding transcriptional regulator, partial [Patescibacteria group bacterium]|nr:YebC/PmpR family DNA-binding transcriptional regulator [Patescibacteria group bacterium]
GLGLIDWQDKDGEMMLITEPQSIGKVINKLKEANVGISDGAIQYLPKNPVKLAKESEASLERLVETLLDQADVQDVYINAE